MPRKVRDVVGLREKVESGDAPIMIPVMLAPSLLLRIEEHLAQFPYKATRKGAGVSRTDLIRVALERTLETGSDR